MCVVRGGVWVCCEVVLSLSVSIYLSESGSGSEFGSPSAYRSSETGLYATFCVVHVVKKKEEEEGEKDEKRR